MSKKAEHLPSPLFFPVWRDGEGGGEPHPTLRGSLDPRRARRPEWARQNQTLLLQGVQAKHLPGKNVQDPGAVIWGRKSQERRIAEFLGSALRYRRPFIQDFSSNLWERTQVYTGVNPSPLGSLEASCSPQMTNNDPGNKNEERSPILFALTRFPLFPRTITQDPPTCESGCISQWGIAS